MSATVTTFENCRNVGRIATINLADENGRIAQVLNLSLFGQILRKRTFCKAVCSDRKILTVHLEMRRHTYNSALVWFSLRVGVRKGMDCGRLLSCSVR